MLEMGRAAVYPRELNRSYRTLISASESALPYLIESLFHSVRSHK